MDQIFLNANVLTMDPRRAGALLRRARWLDHRVGDETAVRVARP